MAPARNARAAPRALASPDISSRRRTTRSRLYGNRGPPYVRANSAASSRVRTVTSRTRRMGGWNTKSVMSQTSLTAINRRERPLSDPVTLLYHYYTTTITPVSLLYYPYIIPQFFLLCARRVTEQIGGPGTPGNGATSSADHQAPWLWLWPPPRRGGSAFPVAPLLPYVASAPFGQVLAGRRATPLRLPGGFKRRLSGSRAASFRSSA